jgi:hypothetical protein
VAVAQDYLEKAVVVVAVLVARAVVVAQVAVAV